MKTELQMLSNKTFPLPILRKMVWNSIANITRKIMPIVYWTRPGYPFLPSRILLKVLQHGTGSDYVFLWQFQ